LAYTETLQYSAETKIKINAKLAVIN